MDFITIITLFSPISKEADTLNLFCIASALSILLPDDLSLSGDPFPYKANKAKLDITIDHHFYT